MPNYSGDGSGDTGGGSAQSQGGSGGWSGDGGAIGGSGGNDLDSYGGFGGLGIGNPGSYGGVPSVGAPGFYGGYDAADIADGLRAAEDDQNPMNWTGAIKAGLGFLASLFSGNPIGALVSSAAVGKQVMDYIQRGDDMEESVKKTMSGMGYSQMEINEAWDAKAKDNPQVGAIGGLSVKDGSIQNSEAAIDALGGNANDLANLAVETNGGIGGQSGVIPGTGISTATIPEQFQNMFVGDDPQFNIPQMAQGYVDDVNSAFTDYTQQANDITGSWQDFENRYSSIGASILDDYDGVRSTYEKNMQSIPGLNIKLPTNMGGASIAMAPNQWGNFYSQQAGTSGGLIDSKASVVPKFAGIESTGITNRQNMNQNMFGNQMITAQENRYPLDLANQLGSAEQQFKYGVTLNDSNQPDGPEWYESAIPAVAYAASSGGLSDAWDAVSSIFG